MSARTRSTTQGEISRQQLLGWGCPPPTNPADPAPSILREKLLEHVALVVVQVAPCRWRDLNYREPQQLVGRQSGYYDREDTRLVTERVDPSRQRKSGGRSRE